MAITRILARIGMIVAAVAMLIPVGSAATATAATPVPVNTVDYAVSVPTAQADEYETQDASACLDVLEGSFYTLTATRRAICAAMAAFPNPTPTTLAVCTAALAATGVVPWVGGVACAVAINP